MNEKQEEILKNQQKLLREQENLENLKSQTKEETAKYAEILRLKREAEKDLKVQLVFCVKLFENMSIS